MYQVANSQVVARGGRALLRRRGMTRVSRTVILLGVASMFTDISSEMVKAILPIYLVFSLGMSPLQFGVIDGIQQGAAALMRIFGGFAADGWAATRKSPPSATGCRPSSSSGCWSSGRSCGRSEQSSSSTGQARASGPHPRRADLAQHAQRGSRDGFRRAPGARYGGRDDRSAARVLLARLAPHTTRRSSSSRSASGSSAWRCSCSSCRTARSASTAPPPPSPFARDRESTAAPRPGSRSLLVGRRRARGRDDERRLHLPRPSASSASRDAICRSSTCDGAVLHGARRAGGPLADRIGRRKRVRHRLRTASRHLCRHCSCRRWAGLASSSCWSRSVGTTPRPTACSWRWRARLLPEEVRATGLSVVVTITNVGASSLRSRSVLPGRCSASRAAVIVFAVALVVAAVAAADLRRRPEKAPMRRRDSRRDLGFAAIVAVLHAPSLRTSVGLARARTSPARRTRRRRVRRRRGRGARRGLRRRQPLGHGMRSSGNARSHQRARTWRRSPRPRTRRGVAELQMRPRLFCRRETASA